MVKFVFDIFRIFYILLGFFCFGRNYLKNASSPDWPEGRAEPGQPVPPSPTSLTWPSRSPSMTPTRCALPQVVAAPHPFISRSPGLIPLFWKSVNFACMWIVFKIFYVIAIYLNFLMIPHVIITREENMIVEIFMLLNYLSLG